MADTSHQEPLTLVPTANMPAHTLEPGFWRKALHTDEELYGALMQLLEKNEARMTLLQRALDRELPADDGYLLSRAITWLDSQVTFMERLLADAEGLLDVAEAHFLIPAGRNEICTDEEGKLIPSDAKGWSFDLNAATPEETKAFKPRWNNLTTNDREVDCAAKCVAFRRLRNEYKAVAKGLESKLYKASALLDELKARHRAAGVVERSR
jgi:hypothetical protein